MEYISRINCDFFVSRENEAKESDFLCRKQWCWCHCPHYVHWFLWSGQWGTWLSAKRLVKIYLRIEKDTMRMKNQGPFFDWSRISTKRSCLGETGPQLPLDALLHKDMAQSRSPRLGPGPLQVTLNSHKDNKDHKGQGKPFAWLVPSFSLWRMI